MKKYSPWGPIQFSRTLAPGITRVTTASHGGVHLSPDRVATLQSLFPFFRPWTGEWAWLEEDCDALIAYITFPDLPHNFDLAEAWEFFRDYQPEVYPSGKTLLKARGADNSPAI